MRCFSISIFRIILIDVVLYFLPSRLKKFIQRILIILGSLMFVVDFFAVFYYGTPFNGAMMQIIFLTATLREAFEFSSTYLNLKFIIYTFCALTVVIIIKYILLKILSLHKFLPVIFVSCSIFAGFAGSVFIYQTGYFTEPFNNIAPIRLYQTYLLIRDDNKNYEDFFKLMPKEILLTENKSTIPYFIFILGESTTRNHMSLYDYNLNTNPKLSIRAKNSELYIFRDTVSPHDTTSKCMKEIFTFHNYESKKDWAEHVNLIQILNKANYNTICLSNQDHTGFGNILLFFADQYKKSRYTKLRDMFSVSCPFDGELLKLLDQEIQDINDGKNFILLHPIGGHFAYKVRYPEEFNKFSYADEKGYNGISKAQKQMRAEYDNAILYNDFVIDEIIKRFENKNAIVIYISDHGEEVFDDSAMNGHGMGNTPRRTKNLFEIPFIIWVSDEFKNNYPELCEKIKNSVDLPYMTDDIIHTVLDILEIKTPDYDPTRSIINEKFNFNRKRIIGGKIYEK